MSRRDRLNKSMDTLFPQEHPDQCRVCNEDVVDGRWNYCSERCREIAEAVQRMFLWDTVRDRVLGRDDYTCRKCGLSKERWWRAYWQIREMVDDYVGVDGTLLDESSLIESPADGGFHVDHIERIADGGHPLDETNLQTLCKHCHREKTAAENSSQEPAPEITLEDYIES